MIKICFLSSTIFDFFIFLVKKIKKKRKELLERLLLNSALKEPKMSKMELIFKYLINYKNVNNVRFYKNNDSNRKNNSIRVAITKKTLNFHKKIYYSKNEPQVTAILEPKLYFNFICVV